MKVLEIILYGIAIIALVAFLVAFFTWLLVAIGVFIAMFFVAWLCGVPITITKDGHKSVYRWTKRIR